MVNLWSTQNCHLLLVTVKWSIYSKNNSRLKLPIQSGWSGIIILWQPCRNVQVHWVEHIAITEEVHSVGHPQMNVSGKVLTKMYISLCFGRNPLRSHQTQHSFSWHGKPIRCTEHAGRFKALQSVKRSFSAVLVFRPRLSKPCSFPV